MRWILCGKNTAGAECLDFLVGRGDEVWAIGTASDDGRDGWQRSFRRAATHQGVRFDQPPRINAREIVDRMAAFGATALVSVQYDQILHARLLGAIGCPCLNLHFALLPRHRGVAPIAWALLSGDDTAGVSLHHMIVDIDAGDVIAQRAVTVRPEQTARELYDALSTEAVRLVEESYPFPEELLAKRLPQDGSVASYHRVGDLDFSDRTTDWNRPADRVQRWLRAMIFPPMQYPETSLDGGRYRIARVGGSPGEVVAAPPGTVVARAFGGIDVATSDRTVRILEMTDCARPDRTMRDIAASIGVGDRFLRSG